MPKRPNILLVMADQLAAPMLPVYGQSAVRAPRLSALAEGGVVFDNAYCNFPICAPSRASLHAGALPHRLGCFDNAAEFRADIPTLPHYLRDLGYSAQLCGKMHFVGPDQLHGYERRLTTEIYPSNFAWTPDWTQGREFRPTNLTMAAVIESGPCVRSMQMDYDDEVVHCGEREIYDLARDERRRPFFLTVSFTHPHSPFVIGGEYWSRHSDADIPPPAAADIPPEARDILSRNLYYCHARHLFTVTDDHVRRARRAYCGMISYLDDNIGRLLDALRECGLADDTVVVATADHGEMLGERGMWFKQHFYEWSARVPLIVHFPAAFRPQRVRENVSLVDLAPTLLDIATDGAGTDWRAPVDGRSLTGLLSGGDPGWPDLAVSEYSADGSTGPSRMARKGPWKYADLEGEDRLLFNLEDDPLEQNNRASDPACAGIVAELDAALRDGWDREEVRAQVLESQRRRLFIHRATGGEPDYVPVARVGDERRYVRNTGAADAKARARLPFVPPARPDRDPDRGGDDSREGR